MSEHNGRRLPPGWEEAPLGSIGDYINGRGFKKSEWRKSGRPIIRIQDLTGSNNSPNYFDGSVDERHVVKNGDLLISWSATLGAYIWRGPESLLNQHIFKVQTFIDKRFHYLLTQHVLDDMVSRTHGTGMVHITKDQFDRTIAPLPPLAEQSRIADALDELFSDLDAGVAALEGVRKKLKLYRVSVLKAAVEGLLTAEWRAQHPHTEPADKLLERILAERRRTWEDAQLAKAEVTGQGPPKKWKARYMEPSALATADLPAPPDGWCWVSLGQLLHGIEAGKSFTCEPRAAKHDEWGVIKVSAMSWGSFDEGENKAVPRGKSYNPEHEIRSGDLLLSRSNTVELVGAVVLVDQCRPKLLLSDKSMRLRSSPLLNKKWLQFALAGRNLSIGMRQSVIEFSE